MAILFSKVQLTFHTCQKTTEDAEVRAPVPRVANLGDKNWWVATILYDCATSDCLGDTFYQLGGELFILNCT